MNNVHALPLNGPNGEAWLLWGLLAALFFVLVAIAAVALWRASRVHKVGEYERKHNATIRRLLSIGENMGEPPIPSEAYMNRTPNGSIDPATPGFTPVTLCTMDEDNKVTFHELTPQEQAELFPSNCAGTLREDIGGTMREVVAVGPSSSIDRAQGPTLPVPPVKQKGKDHLLGHGITGGRLSRAYLADGTDVSHLFEGRQAAIDRAESMEEAYGPKYDGNYQPRRQAANEQQRLLS